MEEVTFGLILEEAVKQERAREQLERRFHKDMKFTEQTKENSKECRDSKYKEQPLPLRLRKELKEKNKFGRQG